VKKAEPEGACDAGEWRERIMGIFKRLFDGTSDENCCQRCGKKLLKTEEFFAKCEEAGLVVDRSTGEAKARMGGFSMVGSMIDASARLDGQRRTQQQLMESLENQRGFRCKGGGHVYCMDCLFNHAPAHPSGGKACPKCGNIFEVLN
jgi:hypothetical protein